MKKRDAEREQRVALALLVRRHLIEYVDEIKIAYYKKHPKPVAKDKPQTEAKGHGTKASTALAKLIGLDAYRNPGKGKPEPAKHLFDFVQSAGPEHFAKIWCYFTTHVITPDYRAEAPPYIQMAIHEVFDVQLTAELAEELGHIGTAAAPIDAALQSALDQARYAPHAVIAAIEDRSADASECAKFFEGTWNVIRYAHHGKRVVRLAMEVTCTPSGRATFKLYFRTRGLTASKSPAKYVTRGSLIVLKGGQHVMFLGQEETRQDRRRPHDYPVIFICPTRISRDGPFIGLVMRRHDDGKIFSTKAHFLPANGCSMDDLLADNKIGSFEPGKEVDAMASDISGFQDLLSELERKPDDVKGGLVL